MVASVLLGQDEAILHGILACPAPDCRREVPVIDGVPLLMADLRAYVAANVGAICGREDLPAALESLIGDCCGPGSAFDSARHYLSAYAWDHYGGLDPAAGASVSPPGAAAALLARGLELAGELPAGPVLDLGCAVGGTTFELARATGRLTLGADLNVGMLRVAARALQRGEVQYPRRRVGVVYDRRSYAVELPAAGQVDFWAFDATAPPLADGTFALVAGLNLLDCVASPLAVLAAIERLLVPGGKAILTTPYDWSPSATAFEGWLGGHSQRGPAEGAAEPVLRALLIPGAHPASLAGLRLVAEETDLPWRVRLHERSTMEYRVHLVVAERL